MVTRALRGSRARVVVASAIGAACSLGLACNSILGNSDGVYVAAPDGATNDDGGSARDTSTSDAPVADGGADVGADACSPDLDVDDKNCGACGHDCMGAGCAGGRCKPVTLRANQNAPLGIALDTLAVYFTTSGGFDAGASDASPFLTDTITRCDLPSCASSGVLASNQANPVGIAVTGGTVYWTDNKSATVASCGTSGCGGAPNALTASAGAAPWELVADTTAVYWTNNTGDVRTCPTAGCSGFPALVANPGANTTPTGIALGAGGALYFTQRGTSPNFVDGAVMKTMTTGGTPTRMAGALQTVNGITADATNVYFVTSGDGSVWSCPIATGCDGVNANKLVLLANAQNSPWRIAVDATDVYWTNKGDGTVMRCKIGGCANKPTRMGSGPAGAWGIALDARFVYWTATGTPGANDGAVLKVAK